MAHKLLGPRAPEPEPQSCLLAVFPGVPGSLVSVGAAMRMAGVASGTQSLLVALGWASLSWVLLGTDGKESACGAVDPSLIPELGGPPEKGMAPHSSVLAWSVPRTEEPGRLQCQSWTLSWRQVLCGLNPFGGDTHTHTHTRTHSSQVERPCHGLCGCPAAMGTAVL